MQAIASHLPILLKTSGEASILILLVLMVQCVCGGRLKPRWRFALWLLVLLRLALPWTIPSPASLFNVLKLPAGGMKLEAEATPVQPLTATVQEDQGPAATPASSGTRWLAWLWGIGAALVAGVAAVNQCRFRRRVSRLRPLTDGPTLSLLEDCKALMGVGTPVMLIQTEAVQSPMLFGFVRPRILLPQGLVCGFTRGELRHVFLHELAHIKRLDILTSWVAMVLQTVHWFNPLVWLASYRLRTERELACDALALSHAGAGEQESYGLTIIKLLERFGQPVWAPGLTGILESKKQVKERIRMIAKFHKSDRGLALAVLLLAGLGLATLTDAQTGTQPKKAKVEKPDAAKGVWAVRFEPVDDFSPKTPGEYLQRIHIYSGQDGMIGYFRTQKQGDKLAGSFLASDPDQLKEALAKVSGLKVTSIQKLTQEQLAQYEKSPQESLIDFEHPDVAKGVWVVRFEPVGDFSPQTPGEYLQRIHVSSGQHGMIGHFRTRNQDGKLLGSFLAYSPDELKGALAKVPGLKVTSVEKLTREQLAEYDQLPQESLVDFEHPDAAKGVWVVKFEPVGDFSPQRPQDYLQRINIYSGQHGMIGHFRTTKKGDKLLGAFLAYNPDALKTALTKVEGLKVTSVQKLTQAQIDEYDQLPQESL